MPVVRLDIRRKRPPNLLALRRWLAEQRGAIDVLNTHSSTDSWLAALACATLADAAADRAHAPRVDDDPQPADDALALHARDRAHRHDRRGAAAPARARQRRAARPHDVDPDRHRPRALRARRRRRPRARGSACRARPTLGIVATLRDWKGHDYLFEALARDRAGWARLERRSSSATGRIATASTRSSRALGLADRVRFAGQQDDVVPWLQALDLFALPSCGEEGVPQAIMQAMACAIPVVSTTGRRDHRGGRRRRRPASSCRRATSPALGAALARLRDDAALRARFGAAARARAVRDFGLDRMLDRDGSGVPRASLEAR